MHVCQLTGTRVFNSTTMNTRSIFYILALFVFAAACRKTDSSFFENTCLQQASYPFERVGDITPPYDPPCFHDPQELFLAGYPYDYSEPCFNPSNSNQIAYYRYDAINGPPAWDIWVQDLCSDEKRMLVSNAYYGIDWSVKDWIVYTASDHQMYMIKSNGDSLTKLTDTGDYNRRPKWDSRGENILFKQTIGGVSQVLIFNIEKSSFESLPELRSSAAWNWINDEELSYIGYGEEGHPWLQLFKFNLSSKESIVLHKVDIGTSIKFITRSTDFSAHSNSVVWCAYGAIGKTNLYSGNKEILLEASNTERFESAVVSNDGKYILFDISRKEWINPCLFDSDYGLYVMDINGQNLRRIILD